MALQVTLWKTGLLFNHKVAQTRRTARLAIRLRDPVTHAACTSHQGSHFYGIAHATVSFGGRDSGSWARSPHTIALPCGT